MQRAKEVFPGLYEPEAAARVVSDRKQTHVVFLRGACPPGFKCGRQLYDWTNWRPLAPAMIQQSVGLFLGERYQISEERIADGGRWASLALRPVAGMNFEHLSFAEGVYFRALRMGSLGDFGLLIDWKSRVSFRNTLAHPDMQQMAEGCSVILRDDTGDSELSRRVGRYVGHVKRVGADVELDWFDGTVRRLPSDAVAFEASPRNLARFERFFPKLAPRGGTAATRLVLDKTLTPGGLRNMSVFKDRLKEALAFLAANSQSVVTIPLAADPSRTLTIHAEPMAVGEDASREICSFALDQPSYVFAKGAVEPTRKKIEGLVRLGPFEQPANPKPIFGFIFAEHHREDARRLFSGLRDGTGYFRGLQNWFRLPLKNNQVISVSGFETSASETAAESAAHYASALRDWLAATPTPRPDLFFVLHDKTEREEETSPYYACKALLLEHGIMTQNVTADLVHNSKQFEWAAGNIALATFSKLGGTAWTLEPSSKRRSLIIGIGRTEVHDPTSRFRRRYQAFATCISSMGKFGFVSVYPVAGRDELRGTLEGATRSALEQAERLDLQYDSLVVHLTGDLPRDEIQAVEKAASEYKSVKSAVVCVIAVSDRADLFAVSSENPGGVPSRGQLVRFADDRFLLYTEGVEDLRTARNRVPGSVQISLRHVPEGIDEMALIAQVYDLSQVNFRGFNAASKPISLLYSDLIARFLRSEDVSTALLRNPELNSRMWFL